MPFVVAGGHRLEYARIGAEDDEDGTLVLLHEGLGSIAMWRDFPERLAAVTRTPVVVYSRYGYGESDALDASRTVRYMHDEALVTLPQFLDALSIERPLLVGHSDGGSIALIYAGASGRAVAGVVTLAAHVIVEDVSIASIAVAREAYRNTDLRSRLARYHAEVDGAFRGWNDIWLASAFREWNIEEYLPRIECPVLAIQGEDDEYGTMDQLARIARGARDVELLRLDACRHSPHRDQPDALLAAITRFVERVGVRKS
jgi:pimeloyl-ACP methyl ester carboxylesterase